MDPIQIKSPTQGVRRDLDPEDVPENALANAQNVLYRDGEFIVRPGVESFGNMVSQTPVAYIEYIHTDGVKRVIKGTASGWHSWDGSNWVSITGTPLTGDASARIVFRTFPKSSFTWLLGANGVDTPKKWDGVSLAYSDVGGAPPIAKCLGVIADRAVLGNLSSGGTISPVGVDVSAHRDFDAGWGSVLTFLCAESPGHIVGIQELGDLQGAIIKTDAVYMLIAQSGAAPFRRQWVKNLDENSGPVTNSLIFKLSSGECGWLGLDASVSIFNGASVTLLPYHVQKCIASLYSPARLTLGWASYDSFRRELWLMFPLAGDFNVRGGVVINMTNYNVYPVYFPSHFVTAGGVLNTGKGLTIGDLAGRLIGDLEMTIGELGASSATKTLVLGHESGQSIRMAGHTDTGTPVSYFWESGVVGRAGRFTTVHKVRHRFKPTVMAATVSVKLGKRNEGGSISYGPSRTVSLNNTRRKVTAHRSSAEYFSLRFDGSASDEIAYQGSALYASLRGER